ncbi:MAG TPA: hypothetical protein VI564_06240 [Candidatus Nanoarchaeia archaeon]|nr:hypothetical protein [Candidatus Nanoarchaeia archaeon]
MKRQTLPDVVTERQFLYLTRVAARIFEEVIGDPDAGLRSQIINVHVSPGVLHRSFELRRSESGRVTVHNTFYGCSYDDRANLPNRQYDVRGE